MPVKSSSSPVLKWPDADSVKRALKDWADAIRRARSDVLRIGYFGSYAGGRPGPGSDLDVVVVVDSSGRPFEQRSAEWDLTGLPVPADLLVYTRDEWEGLDPASRFARMIKTATVWV